MCEYAAQVGARGRTSSGRATKWPLGRGEPLAPGELGPVVEHRIDVLELVTQPGHLEADVTAAADEDVGDRAHVLDQDLDRAAAEAVQSARAGNTPDRTSGWPTSSRRCT